MTEKIDQIRAAISGRNLTENYWRDGCRSYLREIPNLWLIKDIDKVLSGTWVRRDFIWFLFLENREEIISIPIELNSANVDVSQAIDQLKQGHQSNTKKHLCFMCSSHSSWWQHSQFATL